jgi:hypothetical protein
MPQFVTGSNTTLGSACTNATGFAAQWTNLEDFQSSADPSASLSAGTASSTPSSTAASSAASGSGSATASAAATSSSAAAAPLMKAEMATGFSLLGLLLAGLAF